MPKRKENVIPRRDSKYVLSSGRLGEIERNRSLNEIPDTRPTYSKDMFIDRFKGVCKRFRKGLKEQGFDIKLNQLHKILMLSMDLGFTSLQDFINNYNEQLVNEYKTKINLNKVISEINPNNDVRINKAIDDFISSKAFDKIKAISFFIEGDY